MTNNSSELTMLQIPEDKPELLQTPAEIDPEMISFAEVDSTLDRLMEQYTGQTLDQKIEDPCLPPGRQVEKAPKKGWVRGALIPIAASLVGTGSGYLFNSKAYELAKSGVETAEKLPGWVRKIPGVEKILPTKAVEVASGVFDTLGFLEKFTPMQIASVGAGVGSLVSTGIRRAFGENLFDYYSRYSHLEAKDGILKPVKQVFNWFARGLEHLAFNNLILNPSKLSSGAEELIDITNDENVEIRMSEVGGKGLERLITDGYMQLLSSEATKYFGAEFSDEEKARMEYNTEEVRKSLDMFMKRIPEEKKAEFEDKIIKNIKSKEGIRYLISSGLMAGISSLKAFGFGQVVKIVEENVLPILFPRLNKPSLSEVPSEVPVDSKVNATVPKEVPVPKVEDMPVPQHLPQPVTKPVSIPVPQGEALPVMSEATPAVNTALEGAETDFIYRIPNVVPAKVEAYAEASGVVSAVEKMLQSTPVRGDELQVVAGEGLTGRLPELVASGAGASTGEIPVGLTVDESLNLLQGVFEADPVSARQAWTDALPELHKQLAELDPESGILNLGPDASWEDIRKVLFVGGATVGAGATAYLIWKILKVGACTLVAGPAGTLVCAITP